jgi:hypothetical protein
VALVLLAAVAAAKGEEPGSTVAMALLDGDAIRRQVGERASLRQRQKKKIRLAVGRKATI